MKVLVQWALLNPQDWFSVDSTQWNTLASKPPLGGPLVLDNNPGWVFALDVQGIIWQGFDHYGVVDLGNGNILVGAWFDTLASGQNYAHLWALKPVQLGRFTDQFRNIYAEAGIRPSLPQVLNGAVFDYSQFFALKPAAPLIRNGVKLSVMTADQIRNQLAAQTVHGVDEWSLA